jgi:hypothetical protein
VTVDDMLYEHAGSIRYDDARRYVESRGWKRSASRRTDVRAFHSGHLKATGVDIEVPTPRRRPRSPRVPTQALCDLDEVAGPCRQKLIHVWIALAHRVPKLVAGRQSRK